MFFFAHIVRSPSFCMSVSELVIPIKKSEGSALGFTLLRDSCSIHKVLDKQGGDICPGDVILSINDVEVSEQSIREVLRSCRHLSTVVLTVARGPPPRARTRRHENEAPVFGIVESPRNKTGCFCFSKKALNNQNMQIGIGRGRQASLIGSDASPRQQFGSVSSLSSTGVRPVDLRKLHKEGAGTMWMVSRGNSIR